MRSAVPGQRLVDGVVDHLVHEVVQPPLTGRPDVHAGPFADGVESLENRDRTRVVGGVVGRSGHVVGIPPLGLRWALPTQLMPRAAETPVDLRLDL